MRFSILGMLVCVLLACSSNPLPDELPQAEGLLKKYFLGVGDKLEVNVWKNPDLSATVPVRPDGKITIPLVGDVMAAGRTAEELSADIKSGLQKYVKSPQVTVTVLNAESSDFQNRVRIVGAVLKPQSVPYRNGMTVLDLVLLSGGLNQFAASNKAKLYRRVDGLVNAYPIYLDDILKKGKLETNYPLTAADIVSVPERGF